MSEARSERLDTVIAGPIHQSYSGTGSHGLHITVETLKAGLSESSRRLSNTSKLEVGTFVGTCPIRSCTTRGSRATSIFFSHLTNFRFVVLAELLASVVAFCA